MTTTPTQTVFGRIDEIADAVGNRVGTSPWVDITQEKIDGFAETTGDRQWIHTDPERARSGPYGTTIAHGFLTLSLLSQFIGDTLVITAPVTLINYGVNRSRFPSPVPVDSRVRGHVEIVSLTPVSLGWEMITRVTVEVENQAKPACVAEAVTILIPEEEPSVAA